MCLCESVCYLTYKFVPRLDGSLSNNIDKECRIRFRLEATNNLFDMGRLYAAGNPLDPHCKAKCLHLLRMLLHPFERGQVRSQSQVERQVFNASHSLLRTLAQIARQYLGDQNMQVRDMWEDSNDIRICKRLCGSICCECVLSDLDYEAEGCHGP